MSSELAKVAFQEAREMARVFSTSALLPADLKGKEADVLFVLLTGAEMGIPPMTALRSFDVIKGKVAMKPEAMVAHVRAHASVEFIRCVESTGTSATWESKLRSSPHVAKTTFTIKDAQAAGLTSSQMYSKWPAQMLQWRSASIHCKKNHSDIILGMYSTEEAESFEEKDVTPTLANSPATVDGLKAELRTRRMVVSTDVTPPAASPPRPVEQPADDPALIGWGKNGHLRLDGLTVEQLQWYVDDARKKAEGGDPLWGARWNRYGIALAQEMARTESAPTEAA